MRKPALRIPIETRFWDKVVVGEDGDDCWKWTGATDKFGYGLIGRGGRGEGNVLAHRLSYELHNGSIPVGGQILHSCDNPQCTNPRHLSLGNHPVNMRDMASKGRTNKGEGHKPVSKLTEQDVRAIRKRYSERAIVNTRHPKGGPDSPDAIAAEYGVQESTIRDIVKGRTWTHIH